MGHHHHHHFHHINPLFVLGLLLFVVSTVILVIVETVKLALRLSLLALPYVVMGAAAVVGVAILVVIASPLMYAWREQVHARGLPGRSQLEKARYIFRQLHPDLACPSCGDRLEESKEDGSYRYRCACGLSQRVDKAYLVNAKLLKKKLHRDAEQGS